MSKLNSILGQLESKFKNKFLVVEHMDLSPRALLAKMRKLNELDNETNDDSNEDLGNDMKTDLDVQEEEKKFTDYFNDLNVSVEFSDLEIFEKGVFFGGNIDGQIQWVYKVSDNEANSGFDINYLEDFDPNQEDNAEVIKRIESYYNIFYKYWRDNIIQKD